MALSLGPGFQQWIADHQATPLSNEEYFTPDMSVALVKIATGPVLLLYNKLTNEIVPFVAGL